MVGLFSPPAALPVEPGSQPDRVTGPRGISARAKRAALRHYERLAGRYERAVAVGPLALLRARERAAVLRLAELHDPRVRTVLDAGCGSGFYGGLARRAGKWVHAIDASPSMVRAARHQVDLAEVADLEAFTPGRTYDLVLCCGVLDFVTHPERALDNLMGLVAEGGRLVLLVPRRGAGGLWYRAEKLLVGLRVNAFHPRWIAAQAARRGLTVRAAEYPLPINVVLRIEAARPPFTAARARPTRRRSGP